MSANVAIQHSAPTVAIANVNAEGSDTVPGAIQRRAPPEDQPRIEAEDDEEEQETLKYGAKHVMMLIVPVSLCMILVIVTIRVITMYDLGSQPTIYLVYTPFNEQNKNLSTGK